jgi:2,5-furandicarboxylate decarboxylase 1
MPYPDMRAYMRRLEEAGQLVCVHKEVSPDLELGLICRELADRNGPAALFENVTGSPLPVLVNLFGTRERAAMALEIPESELLPHWRKALAAPVPPVVVDGGPCQEVEVDVDLTRNLPNILWNEGDGGPYITFGLVFAKDPETGRTNMSVYRMQIKGPNKIGMKAQAPKHAGVMFLKAEEMGRPLEIAVAIGADPSLYLASQADVPLGVSEVEVAGALRGAPVEMVRCETVDLEVPATAEIVLEGRIEPGLREEEGPFGEFMGYFSGAAPRQVVTFTRMYHRRNPIYLATYEGKPTLETHVLHALSKEAVYFRQIQEYVCPTVRDVHISYGGCTIAHVYVSIKQQAAGQAKNVALELLKSHLVKLVVVVDEDVDVRNPTEVEWAIATRMQADRDVIILPGMAGLHLDPSQPNHPSGLGAKMLIDATMEFGKRYDLIRLPQDRLEQVRANWAAYGFGPAARE